MDGRTDSPPDPVGDRTASTSTTAAVLAHPAVQRVIGALGAHHVYAEVTVLGGAARTAAQAAAYLGVSPAQIANSLVFAVRDRPGTSPVPLLVLTSGAHRVDTTKVADLLDLAEMRRADAEFVRVTTGFVIGAVAPLGHLRPVRTLVDVSLVRHDIVWAAAGHPRAVFPTSYAELVRISGGHPIEVV